MPVNNNVLECIGRTPLIRLRRVTKGINADVLGKAEMMNPGGSVKDRIALAMIDAAERDGLLKSGNTIIEATAGNTGVGLAIVAAIRGYRCVFVMPEKMSRDKEELLRAYGADVIRTANAPPGDPANFQEVARSLSKANGWFLPDQFSNPANPDVHYHTTGPEIWEDTDGKVDTLVCGVGTGGSLTGAGRFLKERNPQLEIVLADPVGSTLGGGCASAYQLEGIGGSNSPANFDASLVDECISISDKEAFILARRIAREEGMLVGGAAGCAAAAALIYAGRSDNAAKTIVAIFPDTGRNYLSKIFNDDWMRAQGWLP